MTLQGSEIRQKEVGGWSSKMVLVMQEQKFLKTVSVSELSSLRDTGCVAPCSLGVPHPTISGRLLKDDDVRQRLGGGTALNFYRTQGYKNIALWSIVKNWRLV